MGLSGAILAMMAGGWDGYTGDYNGSLMNVIDVPEEEPMKNPVYVRLRQEGWNDPDARLDVANTEVAGVGAMGTPVSAVAALAGYSSRMYRIRDGKYEGKRDAGCQRRLDCR